MKFITVVLLSALYCITTLALTIEHRDQASNPLAALEPREPTEGLPIIHIDHKDAVTHKTSSSIPKPTPTKKTKTTKPHTTTIHTTHPAAAAKSTHHKTTTKKTTHTSSPTSSAGIVAATPIAACDARMTPVRGSTCGIFGKVERPHNAANIYNIGFDTCVNACVCGSTMAECKAFAWMEVGVKGLGTCTLYDRTLENMGIGFGAEVLYDRACYKKSSAPIQTMGALEHKVRRRNGVVDDLVVGALAHL